MTTMLNASQYCKAYIRVCPHIKGGPKEKYVSFFQNFELYVVLIVTLKIREMTHSLSLVNAVLPAVSLHNPMLKFALVDFRLLFIGSPNLERALQKKLKRNLFWKKYIPMYYFYLFFRSLARVILCKNFP